MENSSTRATCLIDWTNFDDIKHHVRLISKNVFRFEIFLTFFRNDLVSSSSSSKPAWEARSELAAAAAVRADRRFYIKYSSMIFFHLHCRFIRSAITCSINPGPRRTWDPEPNEAKNDYFIVALCSNREILMLNPTELTWYFLEENWRWLGLTANLKVFFDVVIPFS